MYDTMEEEAILTGTTITVYNIIVVTDYALGLSQIYYIYRLYRNLSGCFIVNSKMGILINYHGIMTALSRSTIVVIVAWG